MEDIELPGQRIASPNTGGRDVTENVNARRQIQTAVRLLMDLRRCTQAEADSEFAAAVNESGAPAAQLGDALLGLAEGQPADSSPHHAHAQQRWGNLL